MINTLLNYWMKLFIMKNLGNQIQSALELHNLTQKEAAKKLHISPQALNSYIKNRRCPHIHVLCDIAHLLKLDVNTLLGISKMHKQYVICSEEEQKLLNVLRTLNSEYKELLSCFIFLLGRDSKQRKHDI